MNPTYIVILALTLTACKSECIPGEQRACACPGGSVGTQTCRDDGTGLNPCLGCLGAPAAPDLAAAPDLRAPEDLLSPMDLRPQLDLTPPPDLSPVMATYVLQPGPGVGKDTSWGTTFWPNGVPDAPDLDVGGWADWYYDYFEFDLSAAPPAAQTLSARAEFYFSVSVNDPGLEVHRIDEAWTAASVTRAKNPAATYLKPFGKVVPAGFYSTDITDLYKDWMNGAHPNHGIKLVPRSNNQTNGTVAASENPVMARRPKLIVTYLKP